MPKRKPPSADLEPLLLPDEVAEKFGVSAHTVNRWGREGRLRVIKAGVSNRFIPSEVRALLEVGVEIAVEPEE